MSVGRASPFHPPSYCFALYLADRLSKAAPVFLIELTYTADLSRIDAHMRSHVAFLQKYYDSGNFLVSGRKIPRDGGIILAVGSSRAEIEAIIEEDPFHSHGLATFRIVEFRASQRAHDIQHRVDEAARRDARRR
jgi:uncharacterized protein YciI